jgi:hypothetical protein
MRPTSRSTVLAACIAGIWLAAVPGCASVTRVDTRAFLEKAVENLTYDQAVELWGPAVKAEDSGATRDVTWHRERVLFYGNQSVLAFGGFFAVMPVAHGQHLMLSFDKQTGKMTRWSYRDW